MLIVKGVQMNHDLQPRAVSTFPPAGAELRFRYESERELRGRTEPLLPEKNLIHPSSLETGATGAGNVNPSDACHRHTTFSLFKSDLKPPSMCQTS